MDTFLNLLNFFWRMQNYRGFTNDPVYKVYHWNTNDIDMLISSLSTKETFKEKIKSMPEKSPKELVFWQVEVVRVKNHTYMYCSCIDHS